MENFYFCTNQQKYGMEKRRRGKNGKNGKARELSYGDMKQQQQQ